MRRGLGGGAGAMPGYVITVEHAVEVATPEEARAALEARLAALDQGLTAVEHDEAPGRAVWAVRGVRRGGETDEGGD